MGWDWEKLGQWGTLTFNDAQRALYERLDGLPEAARKADPGYKSLSGSDKQVCDDLAALSPADRTRAFIDIPRRQSVEFFRDATALRKSSPAFAANAEVKKVYSQNDNSVLAFSRAGGGDDFLVVGSLNKKSFSDYQIDMPPGKWKEVFNSDAAKYGGDNVGNGGGVFGGRAGLALPAGGYLVLKKVG